MALTALQYEDSNTFPRMKPGYSYNSLEEIVICSGVHNIVRFQAVELQAVDKSRGGNELKT